MATIDSTSTVAEITAAYLDNCGYYEDGSPTMAKVFVTACEAMLQRGIAQINDGEQLLRFSTESLEKAIERAKSFVNRGADDERRMGRVQTRHNT